MVEDLFYPYFQERLGRALQDLGPYEVNKNFRGLYLSCWNPYKSASKPRGAVVACDGSFGKAEYTGGLSAWYLRALAHTSVSNGFTDPVPRVSVEIGYRMGGIGMALKALEAQTLQEAVERMKNHGRVVGLFDGTFYPLIPPFPERLDREAKHLEGYVKAFSSLLRQVEEGWLILLGVVKDSEVNYLRTRILIRELVSELPELEETLMRERTADKVARALTSVAKRTSPQRRKVLDRFIEEFQSQASDEELYDAVASEPGYTTPLALAPQPIFLSEEVKARSENWWDTRLRNRLDSWGFEDLREALDDLYWQTPIATLYWRPPHGLGVYRVDVPASLLGFRGVWGDMEGDVLIEYEEEAAEHLCSILNGLSPAPHTVKPLVDVDSLVRMDEGVFSRVYEPIFTSKMREKGFAGRPKKRRLRELIRGYTP
ncbi:MAG: hypothetical protein ACE5GD_07095 [Candidatus Geothermarchaeales archaeon]